MPVTLALSGLPDSTRQALADLLGSDRLPAARRRLPVERLLTALGIGTTDELRTVVEGLRGPLPDRRAARSQDRADRDALWTWLAQRAAHLRLSSSDPSRMAGWVEAQRLRGARGGVTVHRRRLERALAVLDSLPGDGVPLSSLAADYADGPHALDHGTLLAAIVLEGIATAGGSPRPTNAEETRMMWESVGVAPDPHSSTVIALGLPADSTTPLGHWIAEVAAVSEPVVLSLAHLRRWPVRAQSPESPVFVVENPAVVAELAGGGSGPPDLGRPVLVCSSGRPNVAVVTLLRQLSAAGAPVLQHADFDPAGVAITAWLAERAGATPWRMGAPDYLSGLSGMRDRPPLKAAVPPTPWDPALQQVMTQHGVAVYEEDVRSQLLAFIRDSVG
ncbi:MAG TPA: TIGR02679 family protein [Acidimicrobiales bacterium]|nr:TIGR02679 family protein [Acidimicrobiales bacterium]